MIQNGSYLKVVDNSGAKEVCCLKILSGSKKKYAFLKDIILVSIKQLRSKRRLNLKVAKGEMYKAILVRTKRDFNTKSGYKFNFFENSVILLTKQNKLLGTRIIGSISKEFRYTKFLKIASLSSGFID